MTTYYVFSTKWYYFQVIRFRDFIKGCEHTNLVGLSNKYFGDDVINIRFTLFHNHSATQKRTQNTTVNMARAPGQVNSIVV